MGRHFDEANFGRWRFGTYGPPYHIGVQIQDAFFLQLQSYGCMVGVLLAYQLFFIRMQLGVYSTLVIPLWQG
jgi:hypothetical protein